MNQTAFKDSPDISQLKKESSVDNQLSEGKVKGLEHLITHYKEEYRNTILHIEIVRNSISLMFIAYVTFLGFFYSVKFEKPTEINYTHIYISSFLTTILILYWAYTQSTKKDFVESDFYDIRKTVIQQGNNPNSSSKAFEVLDKILSSYKDTYKKMTKVIINF